jgi:ubiquinone/menaquinone biosynthesis C-methylase UbiE
MSIIEKYIRFCESVFGDSLMAAEADYLRKELKGRHNILDVGCGIGTFEQRLSELTIIGVDSDAEMIKIARSRTTNTYCLADANQLPFLDASFDALFYVTSLEFMNDYKRAIDEAVRVLEPEGKLVAMVLNPESKYFQVHYSKEDSYFRRIKHKNLGEIVDYSGQRFGVKTQYFLGIDGQRIFDTQDKRYASLFILKGIKK